MDQLIFASLSHTHFYWYEVGMLKVPAVVGDRERKLPDQTLAVFDLAKSFSIRKQSYLMGDRKSFWVFIYAMSIVPTVGITRNLNIHVLTQLRPELFRIQLLYNCTAWKST